MTVLFSVLSIAFAASCVWLTIHIVNRRERWAKRTLAAVVIGVPFLYVASFGPVCWWWSNPWRQPSDKYFIPRKMEPSEELFIPEAPGIFWPIGWVYNRSPSEGWVETAIGWYATRRHDAVMLPRDFNGALVLVRYPDFQR